MTALSTTLATILGLVEDKTLAAKLVTLVTDDVREANERGYRSGWADAKNGDVRRGGRVSPRAQRHRTQLPALREALWDERLGVQERIDRDYPDSPCAPSWLDPTYAGERWDEDY